jgi:exopolysaccharide production protein ExoZ
MPSNIVAPAPTSHRIEALDSLRFLAAGAVFISHCETLLNFPQGVPQVCNALLNPNSAVAFFFVLSGYVLHLGWRGKSPQLHTVANFVVKRWFRIYPLYYASLLLAVIVMSQVSFAPFPAICQDEVFDHLLSAEDHSSPKQWLAHFLLIGPQLDMGFLNPPLWTLSVEMRIALLFPWLSWAAGGGSVRRSLAVLTLSLAGFPWLGQHLLGTLALIPLFLMGIIIAEHRERLVARLGPTSGAILLGLGLALYSLPWYMRAEWEMSIRLYLSGAGGACVIVSILSWPALSHALSGKTLVLGGRASYGLYILHTPILVALTYASLKWHLPKIVCVGLAAIVTIFLSMQLYRRLELPMIAYGRLVADKWTARLSSMQHRHQ